MESIRTFRATGTPAVPLPVSKRLAGVCGVGIQDYIGEVRGPFRSLTEVSSEFDHSGGDLTTYGHTALYRFAREFYANGGRDLYIVETELGSEQNVTPTPGASDMEIDISGDLVAHPPQPGTLDVVVDGSQMEEDVDFIVDYTKGVIKFKSAPGAVATDIKWKELVNANVTSSLAYLESYRTNIISIPYAFDNDLMALLKTHCDNGETKQRQRIGFASGVYGDTTDIITAAGGVAQSEFMSLFANKSGYYNSLINDPSDTWLEFVDPSACILGVASSRDPWISLHEKTMQNLNQNLEWTSTEITNLSAAYVNYFSDNGLGGYNSKNGYLLDPDAVYRYVDQMSTWIYIKDLCKSRLFSRNLIGNTPINRSTMINIRETILSVLDSVYLNGGIANPSDLSSTHPGYEPVMSELLSALLIDPSQRNATQNAMIQDAQSTRNVTIYVFYDYQGSLHFIDLYLGAL